MYLIGDNQKQYICQWITDKEDAQNFATLKEQFMLGGKKHIFNE